MSWLRLVAGTGRANLALVVVSNESDSKISLSGLNVDCNQLQPKHSNYKGMAKTN